jgi:hypothetical protein
LVLLLDLLHLERVRAVQQHDALLALTHLKAAAAAVATSKAAGAAGGQVTQAPTNVVVV